MQCGRCHHKIPMICSVKQEVRLQGLDMKKPQLLCSVLLLFLSFSLQVSGQTQEQKVVDRPQVFTENELKDPKFWDSLQYMPILGTEQNGDSLKGKFPSDRTFVIMDFKMLPDLRGGFIKDNKGKDELITRDEFLKKFKDRIWWLQYRTVGSDNLIYQAYQIPSLASMAGFFGQDPNERYYNVENINFHKALRSKVVLFNKLNSENNHAEWQFIVFNADNSAKVGDSGTYVISPSCIFTGIKRKREGENLKTIKVPMDMKYFAVNFDKTFCMIFFVDKEPDSKDPDSKLILSIMIDLGEEKAEVKP